MLFYHYGRMHSMWIPSQISTLCWRSLSSSHLPSPQMSVCWSDRQLPFCLLSIGTKKASCSRVFEVNPTPALSIGNIHIFNSYKITRSTGTPDVLYNHTNGLYCNWLIQNEIMWTAGIRMEWVCDHRSECNLSNWEGARKKGISGLQRD